MFEGQFVSLEFDYSCIRLVDRLLDNLTTDQEFKLVRRMDDAFMDLDIIDDYITYTSNRWIVQEVNQERYYCLPENILNQKPPD